MLSAVEKEFCLIVAKSDQSAEAWEDAYTAAYCQKPRKMDVAALRKRDDIRFEIACRAAARANVKRLTEQSAEDMGVEVVAATLRAQQETMLTIIASMQTIREQLTAEERTRLNPAEAKAMDTASRVSGLIGEGNVTIQLPTPTPEAADALEARRKALFAQVQEQQMGKA